MQPANKTLISPRRTLSMKAEELASVRVRKSKLRRLIYEFRRGIVSLRYRVQVRS